MEPSGAQMELKWSPNGAQWSTVELKWSRGLRERSKSVSFIRVAIHSLRVTLIGDGCVFHPSCDRLKPLAFYTKVYINHMPSCHDMSASHHRISPTDPFTQGDPHRQWGCPSSELRPFEITGFLYKNVHQSHASTS